MPFSIQRGILRREFETVPVLRRVEELLSDMISEVREMVIDPSLSGTGLSRRTPSTLACIPSRRSEISVRYMVERGDGPLRARLVILGPHDAMLERPLASDGRNNGHSARLDSEVGTPGHRPIG